MTSTYKHWQLTQDDDHICWLTFDRKDKSVNALSGEVIKELDSVIDEISNNNQCHGVILVSGKKNGFIAGADIEEFLAFKDEEDAFKLVRQAQTIFDKLEALKIPTVAMINGFCLGGGTELALACHYRVAEESESTRIGLPEVKLGIHPGFGGTVRLPRLIGGAKALDLILSGRAVSGRTAGKMGIVDAAVPERQLVRAAKYYVLNKPSRHKPNFIDGVTNSAPIRPIIAKMVNNKLTTKIRKDHYPAPFAALENWQRYGVHGDRPMVQEAKSIAHCFLTETSRNLVRVFFLQEKMKGLAKGVDFKPKHVHVIGAGTMGGDIAAWCALRGMTVTLEDREAKYIAPAIARASKLFNKKLKLPRLVSAAMDRLMPDVDGTGVKHADVVIEAIFENKEAKQQLYKRLEQQMKPDAVLATNTSSLPLDELNTVLKKPERLVGIHFFNPVAKMMLVEVVKGDKTAQTVVDKAVAFVRAIDKLPLPVSSKPGFLVNRVLMPYLMEAVLLLEEGVPAKVIDQAALDFGMPMGPIELADTVGLDVGLSVAKILTEHYGGEVPKQLEIMVEKGDLGRKTGRGFYKYQNGKPVIPAAEANHSNKPEITDRLILRMLNEAIACLRENVVSNDDLADAGMVFGTGFAPFRGGPVNYAKARGIANVRERMDELAAKYGDRFKADSGWSMFQDKLPEKPSQATTVAEK